MPVTSVLGRPRQEDCPTFTASQDYIAITRPQGYMTSHCLGKERRRKGGA